MRKLYLALAIVAPAPFAVLLNCSDTSSSPSAAPSATGAPTLTSTAPTATATGTTPVGASDSGATDSGGDPSRYCDLGFAKGDATGGNVIIFDKEGNPLPSAHYRITYADGCMQYGSGQSFTIHAYEPGDAATYGSWALVNGDAGFAGFQSVPLPGIWIFGPDASAPDAGSYASCVELNRALPPVEFDYDAGAPLGVVIDDTPLGDNVVGPDGGSPTWHLEVFSPTGVCP